VRDEFRIVGAVWIAWAFAYSIVGLCGLHVSPWWALMCLAGGSLMAQVGR
jgi:hypothetical protein